MDNNHQTTEIGELRVCSVCHSPLVRRSRSLAGIHSREDTVVEMQYHTTYVCPKRRGIFGLLFFLHDRRIFRDDASEVIMQEDEIEIRV